MSLKTVLAYSRGPAGIDLFGGPASLSPWGGAGGSLRLDGPSPRPNPSPGKDL